MKQTPIPTMIYGTAWKEDNTQKLVMQALTLGFRGIDTANQRKHYYERGVGRALDKFLQSNKIARSEIFLQTKFTPIDGQDERLPYDPLTSLTNQVSQSFASSLEHLQTNYIDSYILHGPSAGRGITEADLEIWQAMEALVAEGKVRYLGISNISMQQLEELYQCVTIKPHFVQNRCFAVRLWDSAVRLFCKQQAMIYQGFSLLTANLPYLAHPFIQTLAEKYSKTVPQIIFRFATQVGILPLTGTTNKEHMQEDLENNDFELSSKEQKTIENLAGT